MPVCLMTLAINSFKTLLSWDPDSGSCLQDLICSSNNYVMGKKKKQKQSSGTPKTSSHIHCISE